MGPYQWLDSFQTRNWFNGCVTIQLELIKRSLIALEVRLINTVPVVCRLDVVTLICSVLCSTKFRPVGISERRLCRDYDGLLWTNKSVPRLVLFKHIPAISVRSAWSLYLGVI